LVIGESVPRRPRRKRSRWKRIVRMLVPLVLVAAVFAAGLAIGQALDDKPSPDRLRTQVRTLQPLPLPPARETVTVTAP
jgi:hypothetical protein